MDMYLPAPKSLKMQAFTLLKEMIVSGIIKDHEMITERRALQQFHISRTPFREAIQTLEAEGWVYNIPYKGTYVSPITAQDIHDVFELRLMLETSIIKKISGNVDAASLKQLKDIVISMSTNVEEQDDYQFISLDRDFHQGIYKLANNQRLMMVSEQISDMIRRIGIRVLYRDRRKEVIDEHQQIIAGLLEGTAEETMIQHLEKTRQKVAELYEVIEQVKTS